MVDGSPVRGGDKLVAGKYRLERLLGRGGMGSVWEGVHAEIGTRVALKFIEAEFANHPEVRDRFFNEALAAARLRSKHIVQVYDSGVDEGRPYIVMEFLSGEPLDERLVREGTLTLADAASIVRQLSRAMKKAHAAGIVHRDLKPENVYLVWDEEDKKDIVKVVDFGIAKFTDRSGISSATRTGAVLGTPHFMSPEQARGLKEIDGRADVWSIGVIAYRAVTGKLPFDGEAVGDLLVKICTTEPRAPSEHVPVPPEFDEWMRRSLEKDPNQRFANVDEQASALIAFAGAEAQGSAGLELDEQPVSADTVLGVERARLPTRKVSPLGLAALVSVAVVGMAVWFVRGTDPTTGGPDDPAAASAPTEAPEAHHTRADPTSADVVVNESSSAAPDSPVDSEDSPDGVSGSIAPRSRAQDDNAAADDNARDDNAAADDNARDDNARDEDAARGGNSAEAQPAPTNKPPTRGARKAPSPASTPERPSPRPRHSGSEPEDELGY